MVNFWYMIYNYNARRSDLSLHWLYYIWDYEECHSVYDSAIKDFTETTHAVLSYTADSEWLQNTSAFRHHDVEIFQAAIFGVEERAYCKSCMKHFKNTAIFFPFFPSPFSLSSLHHAKLNYGQYLGNIYASVRMALSFK